MKTLFFALERSALGTELIPVTFDERPIPGKRNATRVDARSIREVPEKYHGLSLVELHDLLLSGALG